MSDYIVDTVDSREDFEDLAEAEKYANDWLFERHAELGGWPHDIDTEISIYKKTHLPVMKNKRTIKEMEPEEKEMAEREGWEYICDYKMETIK